MVLPRISPKTDMRLEDAIGGKLVAVYRQRTYEDSKKLEICMT